METVEVVIKISKEVYEWYKKECEENDALIVDNNTYAIGTGTPLPKGHGRLIDADELIESLDKMAWIDSQPRAIRRCIRSIEKEPTIIEADKEDK